MRLSRALLGLTIACGLAMLGGCADAGIDYPRTGFFSTIKEKLLTEEEKKAAIRNLSQDQETHQKSAIREIEKR